MTRAEIDALLDRRMEAWRRRDLKMLTAFYAPDAVLESPISGTSTGPREIEESYERLFHGALAADGRPDLRVRLPGGKPRDGRNLDRVTRGGQVTADAATTLGLGPSDQVEGQAQQNNHGRRDQSDGVQNGCESSGHQRPPLDS